MFGHLLAFFSFEVLLGSGHLGELTAPPPAGYTPLSHLLSLKQVCTLTHSTPTANSNSVPLNDRVVSHSLYLCVHMCRECPSASLLPLAT